MKQTPWIKAYIDYLKQICGFAQRTIKFHQRMCRLWDDYIQNQRHRPMANAVADDFLCWIVFRQQQGIGNGTIRKELCAFRTLYKYLFDYGMIPKNPAASLPELICRPAPEQQYLTVDQCFKFINAFDTGTDDGFRNYTMAVILWCTGLRSAELCALKWADIDLDQGTLLVRKGKGGKQRLLFLNDRLWEDMRGYHKKMGGGADEPLFYALTNNQHTANSPKRALSQSALVDMIRHHANGVGVGKKVSPRMFRHTFATQMLEAGVPIEDIKEMLGHDDETETCIYIHVTVEAAKQLLENHNRKISSIRSYIKYLRFRQVDGADDLPVEYLSRARQPYTGPYQTLTAEEVKQLLSSIDCYSILGYRDSLLYSLLYRLGLRIGEALAINLEDINMKKQIITIHGKGRRQRVLPLISDVAQMIQSWLLMRTKVFGAQEQNALFVSKKGNRLSARTAQENFQKIVAQAGPFSIIKITPHSLRHAFATHAIEENADLIVLKAVMGHASIHSTQIYIHPSLETLRKAVNDHIAADILSGLIEEGVVILRMQQKWKYAA